MSEQTEAAVVADIVKKHIAVSCVDLMGPDGEIVSVVAVPNEIKLQSIKPFFDDFRIAPERRKGTAKLEALESFVEHAKRFADKDSAIFADPDPAAPSLTAVLDYHHAGADAEPRFGEHRGVYSFPLSEEWAAWHGRNGKQMSQSDFAEWVENRIVDVADPAFAGDTAKGLAATIGCTFASPSKLLELSRGLTVRTGAKVQNSQNLATGEAQIQYVTQHQDDTGAPLKVPGAFLLALPVFRNGALYQIAARLRYRVREGNVTWFYELHRTDRIFDHAFNEACSFAQKETELPLYLGSPE